MLKIPNCLSQGKWHNNHDKKNLEVEHMTHIYEISEIQLVVLRVHLDRCQLIYKSHEKPSWDFLLHKYVHKKP
jgi:hypothetical protein